MTRLQQFMTAAINEAKKAYAIGEVPVGAVIVKDNQIIAKAHNTVEADNDPTHHAEIKAIQLACEKLNFRSLHECELFVTLEPCAMCTGAIMQARIGKLYFGTADKTAGAVISKTELLHTHFGNRKTEYDYFVMEEECKKLLTDFFDEIRTKFVLSDGTAVYIVSREYFNNHPLVLAKALLGSYIVRNENNKRLVVKIVETEAYCGILDKGSHSYDNKKTARTKVMFGPYGYAYIYMIYGMYNCLNFVTQPEGTPSAILIRAVEPIEGMDTMSKFRYHTQFECLDKKKKIALTNGPGKLCIALGLTKEHNGLNLSKDELYIVRPKKPEKIDIIEAKRVNIDYAQEAADFLWRYYIKGNLYVSKK